MLRSHARTLTDCIACSPLTVCGGCLLFRCYICFLSERLSPCTAVEHCAANVPGYRYTPQNAGLLAHRCHFSGVCHQEVEPVVHGNMLFHRLRLSSWSSEGCFRQVFICTCADCSVDAAAWSYLHFARDKERVGWVEEAGGV